MYLVNAPSAYNPDNPVSILLKDLIDAKERGVYVKVVLDDSRFKQNYNAYKLLKEAGIDISLDTPYKLLHAKAAVIDSNISIVGSYNWSKASLYNNIEYASYLESEVEAKKLITYIDDIKLSKEPPLLALEEEEGVELSTSLLMDSDEGNLSALFTSHSEKAFDLYLYLLKIEPKQKKGLSPLCLKQGTVPWFWLFYRKGNGSKRARLNKSSKNPLQNLEYIII